MITHTHYATVETPVLTGWARLVDTNPVAYVVQSWSLWTKAITKTLIATYIKK